MDYGNQYSTTSYGAGGGQNGGGFMPGSQSDSPAGQRGKYGKDTLRPVTVKQLLDAHHPYPDAEHFMIDDQETTQVTFVGQVRNISQQTTNVTYKVDDGTGVVEVKVWVDSEVMNEDGQDPKKVTEQAYVRVFGRLKVFGNKRHVGANVIRPIQDFNEISYHLLEATVVHLQATRGAPGDAKAATNGAANAAANGMSTAASAQLAGVSASARKVFECLRNSPQTNEGLHMQDIAIQVNMDVQAVMKAGEELLGNGVIYTTIDDHTWAIMDM
ncbi:Replication factor A protein 2 [Oleoguttula sp. CCFEE 5521]